MSCSAGSCLARRAIRNCLVALLASGAHCAASVGHSARFMGRSQRTAARNKTSSSQNGCGPCDSFRLFGSQILCSVDPKSPHPTQHTARMVPLVPAFSLLARLTSLYPPGPLSHLCHQLAPQLVGNTAGLALGWCDSGGVQRGFTFKARDLYLSKCLFHWFHVFRITCHVTSLTSHHSLITLDSPFPSRRCVSSLSSRQPHIDPPLCLSIFKLQKSPPFHV